MSERLTIRSYRGTYTAEFIADYATTIREQLRPGDHLVVDQNVLERHVPLEDAIAPLAGSYGASAPLSGGTWLLQLAAFRAE